MTTYSEEIGARLAQAEKTGLFEWRSDLTAYIVLRWDVCAIDHLLQQFDRCGKRSLWVKRARAMRWRGRYLRRHGADLTGRNK